MTTSNGVMSSAAAAPESEPDKKLATKSVALLDSSLAVSDADAPTTLACLDAGSGASW